MLTDQATLVHDNALTARIESILHILAAYRQRVAKCSVTFDLCSATIWMGSNHPVCRRADLIGPNHHATQNSASRRYPANRSSGEE
jgi:hypothetical protein